MAKPAPKPVPYKRYADREWPDRTTTDHREIGRAVPEDPHLAWWLFAGLVILMLIIAA